MTVSSKWWSTIWTRVKELDVINEAGIVTIVYLSKKLCTIGADSRFAPSQWETALLCNDVSHWLGASLESALNYGSHHFEGFFANGSVKLPGSRLLLSPRTGTLWVIGGAWPANLLLWLLTPSWQDWITGGEYRSHQLIQWHHNERDGVSNHRRQNCLLNH